MKNKDSESHTLNKDKNLEKDDKKDVNSQRVHSALPLSQVIKDIMEHLGIILTAEAGSGKSYCVAEMVKQAIQDPTLNLTVICLSPSTIWTNKLWSGLFVKVGTDGFNPIIENEKITIDRVTFPTLRDTFFIDMDKKWTYVKNEWFESLLRSKDNLLFEIKYKNGNRIKHFSRMVIQIIYTYQEEQIKLNPNYDHHYLIVLEEIANSFGTYSLNTDSSQELRNYFTLSRSDAKIHYIGIGQRLNSISTEICEKLRPFIGPTLGENSLKKIKSQLPKELENRVQQLPTYHWIYLDGKTNPEIVIPFYVKECEPTQIKPPQPHKPIEPIKKTSFTQKLKEFFTWFIHDNKESIKEPILNNHINTHDETEFSDMETETDEDTEESDFWLDFDTFY